MESCIFCKIIKGEIPAEKVYENDKVIAFLDVRPKSPGHTMVIPKMHVELFEDLPKTEIENLFISAQGALNMIKNSLKPDGFTVGINDGKSAGQAVEHLHIHIIPRWYTDGGSSIHSVVSNTPKEDLKTIADKIRKQI